MRRVHGSELVVGDLIDVGIKQRIGKIIRFEERIGTPSGRIAVTDRGSITVLDDYDVPVFSTEAHAGATK